MKLEKIITPRSKRLGRGYGSGKGGHTAGRGQKGQKSRTKIGILFEGTKVRKSLYKRLPFLRGKGKNKPHTKPLVLNLDDLNNLPAGSTVNLQFLAEYSLVDLQKARKHQVKILSQGTLNKKLTVELPVSKAAASKIEQAGGKVVSVKIG